MPAPRLGKREGKRARKKGRSAPGLPRTWLTGETAVSVTAPPAGKEGPAAEINARGAAPTDKKGKAKPRRTSTAMGAGKTFHLTDPV